ncbi:MAG: inorganic phosphate transporter, partial [Ignisphaera sp.]
TMRLLAIYSTIFIGLGGALLGRRVVETMAYRITRLDITTSVAANADAIAVLLYTTIPYILFGYGMPVSTTYAAGAIIGAGIAKYRSLKALNLKLILFIMFAWVITLPVTSSLAIAIYSLLKHLLLG